jgi:hypothetical protein
MGGALAWLRVHWQIIAAPLFIVAVIVVANMVVRPPDPLSSGPILTDNPAGVVEDVPYAPDIDPADFGTTVSNPYWPLAPGTTRTYDGGGEHLVITVTSSTRPVMGIDTIVVRDREYDGASLIEDTEDWFAQDVDGNVWYFGENTAECAGGKVSSRVGAWEAGFDGALPGIVMLASPRLGDYYRQEFYEGQAEDVARVRELGASADHGGDKVYDEVIVTEDFTALEPTQLEYKSYAPGVGLIEERNARGGAPVRLTEVTVDPVPKPSADGGLCVA